MISLYFFAADGCAAEASVRDDAKLMICSRTTPIPLSSDAFNCTTDSEEFHSPLHAHLQHHGRHFLWSVQFARTRQNRCRFASARWSIEQQVRQRTARDECVNCRVYIGYKQ